MVKITSVNERSEDADWESLDEPYKTCSEYTFLRGVSHLVVSRQSGSYCEWIANKEVSNFPDLSELN